MRLIEEGRLIFTHPRDSRLQGNGHRNWVRWLCDSPAHIKVQLKIHESPFNWKNQPQEHTSLIYIQAFVNNVYFLSNSISEKTLHLTLKFRNCQQSTWNWMWPVLMSASMPNNKSPLTAIIEYWKTTHYILVLLWCGISLSYRLKKYNTYFCERDRHYNYLVFNAFCAEWVLHTTCWMRLNVGHNMFITRGKGWYLH